MPGLFKAAEAYAANRELRIALQCADSEVQQRSKLIEDHPGVIALKGDPGWGRLCRTYARVVAAHARMSPTAHQKRLNRLRRILLKFGDKYHYDIPDPWMMDLPAAGAPIGGQPPGNPVRELRPEEFQAFWFEQVGHSQQQIADWLKTTQGTISKWIGHVKRWRDAGNKMPELPRTEPLDSKPIAMDPAKLDLGPRPDHRSEGQRAKLAEIRGHDCQDE